MTPATTIAQVASLGPLRVVEIISSVENEAGGPTYSVTSLSRALARQGAEVEFMSLGRPGRRIEEGLARMTFPNDLGSIPLARELDVSRSLARALAKSAAAGASLHTHGLWRLSNSVPAWIARRRRVPFLISPRGMLAPAALAFSSGRKKLAWALGQRRALEMAACIHATSRVELEQIRALGLTAPIAVIANGIDVSPLRRPAIGRGGPRTLLYLGRLHPIKAINNLLSSWARVAGHNPEWRLRIVGPSEGDHRRELMALGVSLRVPRVTFEDALFGTAKAAAFAEADLFVLPSRSENFGMVVAESLAAGLPVITTKGTPWQGLVEHGCGWWIDHGIEPLTAALGVAMAMPQPALDAMGERGCAWMARDYSWERIAADMADVYRWCLGRGDRPACVHCD